MKLNQSVRYGVACLFELSKVPGEYLDAEYLARCQHIPPAYVQKVLQAMAHAGLVFGLKGSGYRLGRSLSHISALEVIEALTKEPGTNGAGSDLGTLLEKRINQALGSFTLDDLKIAA